MPASDESVRDRGRSRVGRRSILKSALGVGGSSTLAGCFGDDSDGSPTATTSEPGTGRATDTPSPTRSASPTETTTVAAPNDGSVVVEPGGDIQAALEDVAGRGAYGESPHGVVRLQAGETYRVSETITMPLGSILDCNGAQLIPTENVAVFSLSGGTQLKQPRIDARGQDFWDASLIEVTTRESSIGTGDPVRIDQMLIFAPREPWQGTGVKIIDDNGTGMWATMMSGIVQNGEVGIHLKAEGEDSWVNSCFFDGIIDDSSTGILMEEDGETLGMSSHLMNVAYQSNPDSSEWFWDLQSGEDNTIRAIVWDPQHVTDETIWRIGSDAGHNNQLVDVKGKYGWENAVVDEKLPGAPNGAAGNTLFNYHESQAHLDLRRTVDDLAGRLEDVESEIG